jgi:hypothetical protein
MRSPRSTASGRRWDNVDGRADDVLADVGELA